MNIIIHIMSMQSKSLLHGLITKLIWMRKYWIALRWHDKGICTFSTKCLRNFRDSRKIREQFFLPKSAISWLETLGCNSIVQIIVVAQNRMRMCEGKKYLNKRYNKIFAILANAFSWTAYVFCSANASPILSYHLI